MTRATARATAGATSGGAAGASATARVTAGAAGRAATGAVGGACLVTGELLAGDGLGISLWPPVAREHVFQPLYCDL